jgi:hypothetical protein
MPSPLTKLSAAFTTSPFAPAPAPWPLSSTLITASLPTT